MEDERMDGPFDDVVVGADGRDADQDAISLAVALGARRIVLVAAGAHAPEAVARDGVAVESLRVADDLPARALHRVAVERGASLIVVGSAHSALHPGRTGRIVVGSVSRLTLHRAPCPVAIAPLGHRRSTLPLRTIGLAYDGSPAADAALGLCRVLAGARGADVEVHVVETELDHGARKRDQALAALGLGARGFVHRGDPPAELVRASGALDLLVMGSRGLGTESRPGLDSPADRIVEAVHCPVLVVPPGPLPRR